MITNKNKQVFIDVMKLPSLVIRSKIQAPDRIKLPTKGKVEEEGIKEAAKDLAKTQTENKQKLHDLLKHSEEVLYKIKNVIPILADELVIDSNKITFIYRPFFFSERIHSVAVKDVTDVYIETAPFLATIVVIDSGFIDEHSRNTPQNNAVRIKWLWKGNAERARRIITGLMEAAKEGIDLKEIQDDNLANTLEEIGKVRETSTTVSKT